MNTTSHTAKKTMKVIAKADQNTIGTKNVNDIRLDLIFLKSLSLRLGRTPDLYFRDVKITFGMNRADKKSNTAMLNRTAITIVTLILKKEKATISNSCKKG